MNSDEHYGIEDQRGKPQGQSLQSSSLEDRISVQYHNHLNIPLHCIPQIIGPFKVFHCPSDKSTITQAGRQLGQASTISIGVIDGVLRRSEHEVAANLGPIEGDAASREGRGGLM